LEDLFGVAGKVSVMFIFTGSDKCRSLHRRENNVNGTLTAVVLYSHIDFGVHIVGFDSDRLRGVHMDELMRGRVV